ncbi:MAG: hypothetical protein ACH0QD_08570 [Tepidibacillus sp.]
MERNTQIDPHFYSPVYISMAGLKPKDFYGELLRHIGEEPPFSLSKPNGFGWED